MYICHALRLVRELLLQEELSWTHDLKGVGRAHFDEAFKEMRRIIKRNPFKFKLQITSKGIVTVATCSCKKVNTIHLHIRMDGCHACAAFW